MNALETQSPTKAEEKKLYQSFIDACAVESYLHDVLVDSKEFIFSNIDCDVVWPIESRAREIGRDIVTSGERLAELRAEIRKVEGQRDSVKREVQAAKRELRDTLEKANNFLDSTIEARRSVTTALASVR